MEMHLRCHVDTFGVQFLLFKGLSESYIGRYLRSVEVIDTS